METWLPSSLHAILETRSHLDILQLVNGGTMWKIYTMEYYSAIKGNKPWMGQQCGWISNILRWVKETCSKRLDIAWFHLHSILGKSQASLIAQLVKNPTVIEETPVQSLGWEDPLEKRKATHSSAVARRIPWTVSSMGSQRIGHDWVASTFTLFSLSLGK